MEKPYQIDYPNDRENYKTVTEYELEQLNLIKVFNILKSKRKLEIDNDLPNKIIKIDSSIYSNKRKIDAV